MLLEIFKFASPARRDLIAKREDVAVAVAVAVAMAVRLWQKRCRVWWLGSICHTRANWLKGKPTKQTQNAGEQFLDIPL